MATVVELRARSELSEELIREAVFEAAERVGIEGMISFFLGYIDSQESQRLAA